MKINHYRYVFLILYIFSGIRLLQAQWSPAGLSVKNVDAFAVKDTILFAGFYAYPGGVYLTKNKGVDWSHVDLYWNDYVTAFAVYGNNIFAGTDISLYMSTDDGENWDRTAFYAQGSWLDISAFAVTDTNMFIATLLNGVYRSNRSNTDWKQVNNGLTNNVVTALSLSDTSLLAGTGSGGVFLSSNKGSSWTPINNDSMIFRVYSIVTKDSNIMAGTSSGVFLSTNYGKSWTTANKGLMNTHVNSLILWNNYIFAGTSGGVYFFSDKGSSWVEFNSGLADQTVNCLIALGNDIYCGTNSGVFKRSLSDIVTSIEKYASNLILGFKLEQNYPNPFNPSTTIKYSIPKSTYVKIVIYDVMGREVCTLVNEEKSAGNYSVRFTSNSLASGIYFYQIETNEFTQTKMMILLR